MPSLNGCSDDDNAVVHGLVQKSNKSRGPLVKNLCILVEVVVEPHGRREALAPDFQQKGQQNETVKSVCTIC